MSEPIGSNPIQPPSPDLNPGTIPAEAVPPPPIYLCPYPPIPWPPKRREPVDKKDKVFALLFFLFGVVWVDLALMHGFRLGFSIATMLFFVLMTVYLAGKENPLRPYPLCCGLLAVAGSIPFALYQDPVIELISFGVIGVLFSLYGALLTGCFRHSPGGFRCIGDVLNSMFVYPFQYMGITLRSLFKKAPISGPPEKTPARHRKWLGKSLIGFLCAIPALAILVPLLARSDLYFEQLLSHLSFDISKIVVRVLLGALLFPFLFTLIFAWKKKLPQTTPQRLAPVSKGVDPIIIQSFLSVLSLVYLAYLLTQTAYFFSGFQGLLPEGFEQSVTDYARRGFFEMCAIAAINLGILFLTSVLVHKKEGRIPRFAQILSSFLCLFTVLLIGTALSKMVLYISHFGMTRLRLMTSCFMVFLALVFLAVGVRLWIRKFPYMKAIVLVFCLVGLGVSYGNIDTIVARYNVIAYQNGVLETVDVDALARLGEDAVPYLIELLDNEDSEVTRQAHNALVEELFDRFEVTCDCKHSLCVCDDISTYLWSERTSDASMNSIYWLSDCTNDCRKLVGLESQSPFDLRDYNYTTRRAEQLLRENAQRILTSNP